MDNKIFRQKSIDRVSSPDQLDAYIKAASPKMWLLLASIIIFLVGAIVWGTLGTIESKAAAGVCVEDKKAYVFLSEDNYEKLAEYTFVRFGEMKSSDLTEISGPYSTSEDELPIGEDAASYLCHVSEIGDDDWFYILVYNVRGAEDGIFKGELVFEEISPITFVFN